MPKRFQSYLLLLVVVLSGLGLAACGRGDELAEPEETLVAVERGDLDISVTSAGNASITGRADLNFGVAGEVTAVLVEEGDEVTEGQLLARLDAEPLEVDVVKAQATLAAAQDALEQLLEPPDANDLALHRASAAAALQAFDNTKDAYFFLFRKYFGIYVNDEDALDSPDAIFAAYPVDEFIAGLQGLPIPYVTLQGEIDRELGTAWSALPVSQATFQVAQNSLEALEAAPDPVEVQRQEADLASAEYALTVVREKLTRAGLVAPMNGVVTSLSIEPGDSVSGVVSAMALADPASIEITGLVDEVDVLRVSAGQSAFISLSAFPQLQLPGTVKSISILPVNQSGVVSYPVTISLLQRGQGHGMMRLRDGMTVTTTIVINQRRDVLLVPISAVRREEGTTVVDVVGADGSREVRVVALGLTDGVRIEVTSGLSESEQVAVQSLQSFAARAATFFGQGGGFGGGNIRPPGGGRISP
jgi:HlyD family secretion protein